MRIFLVNARSIHYLCYVQEDEMKHSHQSEIHMNKYRTACWTCSFMYIADLWNQIDYIPTGSPKNRPFSCPQVAIVFVAIGDVVKATQGRQWLA